MASSNFTATLASGVAIPGPVGPTGPAGPSGPVGSQGPPGATGGVGPPGPTGPIGSVGPNGPMGPQGPTGVQGLQGLTGPAGTAIALAGSVSTVGNLPTGQPFGTCYHVQADNNVYVYTNASTWVSMGPIQGPTGPGGATGAAGPAGTQGSAGVAGPAGATGATGAQGAPGAQGPPGTGILVRGTVAAPANLPPAANNGDVYYVQSNGHLYVYGSGSWYDMGLAAGPPGPPGPAGAQGPTGTQGPSGAAGQTQSPWLSNINAASFLLNSVAGIGVGMAAPVGGPLIDVTVTTANPGLLITNTSTLGYAAFQLQNNAGLSGFTMYGDTYAGTPSSSAGNTSLTALKDMFFTVAGVEAMRIKAGTGYVGIGKVAPSHLLELGTDSAAKPGTSTWQIVSDLRTKREVRPLEGGLEVIEQLEPIEAEYNGAAGTPAGMRVVSLDPEKVREVLPHAVSVECAKLQPEDESGTELLHLNVHEILFHLILAVKDLARRLKVA